MNKIIREHILEDQRDMTLAFDEKFTPYSYSVGSVILPNDPVENGGVLGKLRRHWVGPYRVTWQFPLRSVST